MGDPESGRANNKEGRANNEEERGASDEEGARIPTIPAPLLSRGMWAARFCSIRKKGFGPKETQSNLGNFNFPKATLTL